MRPATLLRLAASGTRADTVRLVLTVLGSALAVLGWLCAATVATIGFAGADGGSAAYNEEYTSALLREPGLRPGVAATFVLLTVPVLAFVAQCARLGAPARDRRIAAIRLAGATPGQAVAIGAGESGVSALLGSAVGIGVYFVLRRVLDHSSSTGQRTLPTDVLPPVWAIAVIAVAVPVLVALFAAALLRRVVTTPLGVARLERRRRPPRPWPALLIAVGLAAFAVVGFAGRSGPELSPNLELSLLYAGALGAGGGVALSAGWWAAVASRVLGRFGRRAPSQLAAARLAADPWQGSRASGVLIVACLFGGGTAAIYAHFAAQQAVQAEVDRAYAATVGQQPQFFVSETFYTASTLLVAVAVGLAAVVAALGQLVTVVEGIVARRRTNAALVATGVPRGVLGRAQVWQAFAATGPALVLAAAVGAAIPPLLAGSTVSAGDESVTQDGTVDIGPLFRHVPVPWAQLGLVVGLALAAVAITVGIGLIFLKSSTSVEELRTG